MDLIELNDHLTTVLAIADCTGQSTTFNIAYKYLSKASRKTLLKILLTADEPTTNAILYTNIVYVDGVILSNGCLTNSLETAILPALLRSAPYHGAILETFLAFLNTSEDMSEVISNLQKHNLVNIGEWLYKYEYEEQNILNHTEIADEFSDILEFEDIQTPVPAPELRYILSSNVKLYKLYLICRKWYDENRMLNPVVITACCDDLGIKASLAFDLLPLIHFKYLSLMPKDT